MKNELDTSIKSDGSFRPVYFLWECEKKVPTTWKKGPKNMPKTFDFRDFARFCGRCRVTRLFCPRHSSTSVFLEYLMNALIFLNSFHRVARYTSILHALWVSCKYNKKITSYRQSNKVYENRPISWEISPFTFDL